MALTKAQLREILSDAGANPEKVGDAIDRIIAGHTASIEALREERDTFKEEAKKLADVQKELDDLKAKGDDKALEKVQKEFDDFKAKVEGEKTHAAKESAFRAVLKELGVSEKHFAKICKYTDIDSMEMTDEGKLKDLASIRKSIKEEWADHIETAETKGTATPRPQGASSGGSGMTKAEIMKIKSASERQAALKEFLTAENGGNNTGG